MGMAQCEHIGLPGGYAEVPDAIATQFLQQ
jgi:hypothetical protein